MIKIKNIGLFGSLLLLVFGILILLLSIFSFDVVAEGICIIIGFAIIVNSIIPLIFVTKLIEIDKKYIPEFILTIGVITMSVIFMVDRHNLIVSLILTGLVIILSTLRLILSDNKKEEFINILPLLIIGLVLLFNFNDIVFRYSLIALGSIMAIYGLINLILYYVKKDKSDSNSGGPTITRGEVIDAEVREIK